MEPDCCTMRPPVEPETPTPPTCRRRRDVYLLIDTTRSFRTEFCQLHYGTELIISALNPGGSSPTRLGAILYPTLKSDTSKSDIPDLRNEFPRVAPTLLDINTGCEQAMGTLANLIDAVMNESPKFIPENPYLNFANSKLTYPAQAIESLNRNLTSQPNGREKVVIFFTDGQNDANDDNESVRARNPRLENQIALLKELDPNVVILAVGLSDNRNLQGLKADFTVITVDERNRIIDSNPVILARNLITRLMELGVICQSEGKNVYMYAYT